MWVVTLFFTLSLMIIWLLLKTKKINPPLPPGPSGLPVVGNLLSLDPEIHSHFATLARAYGPLFSLRLGTKLGVVVSSPALVREVLKDKDTIFANRDVTATIRVFTYGGVSILGSSYGPQLTLLRKIFIREMHSPAMSEAVSGHRRKEVRRAVRQISGRPGSPVQIREKMFLTVMNIVTGIVCGGTVTNEVERESIGTQLYDAIVEMTNVLRIANFSDFFPVLEKLDLQGVVRKMKKVVKKFDDVYDRVIEQTLLKVRDGVDDKREKDFLQVLLKIKDDYENDHDHGKTHVSFKMNHVKALLMDMVLGATDTNSNTIEFAMAELMNKPEILKKVQDEIDSVVGKDGVVEDHHTYKLPYLQAVMKETLRLHPVFPLLIRHSPSESCIVGGYTIPKGSQVFINVWAIHRDPEIWVNPLEFDPERFLNSSNKFDFNGNNFSYFPFGSGRRICVGIGMAERTVMFMLASLLHYFNWKLPEGEKMNMEEKFDSAMSKKIPLVLIPEPRLTNHALYE